MSKQKIQGLAAFELLEGLDDDMILAATLPEAAPVPVPTKGERVAAFLGRMGGRGVAAAIATVALAVLVGVALAGRIGTVNPPDTDPSQGIQGNQPHESGSVSDTGNGILLPPLEQHPAQDKGEVAVVSDGITVYPRRYDVATNCIEITDEGEQLVWSEGGGLYPMEEIYESLPVLMTAGNAFSQTAPEGYSMGRVRVFDSQFRELSEPTSIEALSQLENGTYYVQQTASIQRWNSETEYVVQTLQYAFCLTVDSNMDIAYPVRALLDGKTYYLEGRDGINSGHALTELAPSIPTATVTRETDMDFYLAPQGTLQSVAAYDGSFRLLMTEPDLEPWISLPAWAAGDYYFVFTATFPFEGESLTLDYPIHIKLVEVTGSETQEETYPNDVGETPEPPRVTVGTSCGIIHFGNMSYSDEYYEGYRLWSEEWYDGGMVSGSGLGATGQLTDIYAELPGIRHYVGETPTVRVIEASDTLIRVSVYDELAQPLVDGADTAVLATLDEGVYIVVLAVVTQGDYIEEAEAYERFCTEYAFIMPVVKASPETSPRVVVSGGGQTAVFETEENGVLMWTEKAGQERKTVTVPNWYHIADAQTIDRLPRMSLKPGDELTLTLDAAGDSLIGVTVYGLNDTVAQGEDLSVISPTLFDKWLDEGVVFSGRVVLQVTSRTGEDEISCYEYVIIIEVAP